jgi:hypothetical protein
VSVYICSECSNVTYNGRNIGIFVEKGNECYNNNKLDEARHYYATAWSTLDMCRWGCGSCIDKIKEASLSC